jgi:sugar/nucleoside kinase (ribokinase family)
MVMVTPDADRTMNTFLGITATYSEEELDLNALKNSKWLYVEGYLVASPSGQKAALSAIDFARKNNVKTAFTMSDPNMVKFFRENINAIIGSGVDLLFCNEDEAKEFTGKDDVLAAREELKKIAKNFVITLGKNGSIIWDGTTFIDIEAYNVDAIDSNGAGDMFAGAFLYGITNGHTFASSGTLASRASSKVVSQFGPRLEKSQAQDIHSSVFKA